MPEALDIETRDGVAFWSMRLAPVNALQSTMLDALNAALDAALADPGIAAVVLQSELRVFSAGADATWMGETIDAVGRDEMLVRLEAMLAGFRSFSTRLYDSRLLSIAAIDGHVLAGGLELAAAFDIRFAVDEPKIQVGVPEMKLFGAMPSGGGGVQFLSRLMGRSRALHFILSGESVTPTRAYELGIVDVLVSEGTARAAAAEFAIRIAAQGGAIGLSATKRAVTAGALLPMSEAQALDDEIHWDTMRRGNFLDGVETFARTFG